MTKRPTLKGKGVEIFLGKERRQSREEAGLKKEKGTFYLPPSILDSLDKAWISLRNYNRKIRKSDIVKAALEEALKRFEKEGKESELFRQFTS
jgi:hypothetical protein